MHARKQSSSASSLRSLVLRSAICLHTQHNKSVAHHGTDMGTGADCGHSSLLVFITAYFWIVPEAALQGVYTAICHATSKTVKTAFIIWISWKKLIQNKYIYIYIYIYTVFVQYTYVLDRKTHTETVRYKYVYCYIPSVCVCVYVYIYIYIYIQLLYYICIDTHTHIYIYIYIYIWYKNFLKLYKTKKKNS